ncbi:LysR family transcriptional regulator [Acuticoccus mangrovi]|uniref:LysR family transcriptional regulator n=1 Tax=Acuticoccus mangrovi TaxID=2796142 RepID=A0A934IKX7_9HYPH|nr:LysR family transcriptional regulator [Acuticoccus mangrovi]MBJ3774187.1 LysR family transcriptional regulator [Acuticoccus mangrovi]
MTLEQLTIFVAVAEREHLTRAARALRLTPSAVSASIKTLEAYYGVRLFERVGRRIELTGEGRAFLPEARETLARVRAAEMVLGELGGLSRGAVDLHASQTIANYWLPPRLMDFHERHPTIELRLTIGNTRTVTDAVLEGRAELGVIEGTIDEPALSQEKVGEDVIVVVAPSDHALARRDEPLDAQMLSTIRWAVREAGSGTRSEFEAGLRNLGIDPAVLPVAMELPSNEAVLTAVRMGGCAAALSKAVVAPFLASGALAALRLPLPPRHFTLLRHRERHMSPAVRRLAEICAAPSCHSV